MLLFLLYGPFRISKLESNINSAAFMFLVSECLKNYFLTTQLHLHDINGASILPFFHLFLEIHNIQFTVSYVKHSSKCLLAVCRIWNSRFDDYEWSGFKNLLTFIQITLPKYKLLTQCKTQILLWNFLLFSFASSIPRCQTYQYILVTESY